MECIASHGRVKADSVKFNPETNEITFEQDFWPRVASDDKFYTIRLGQYVQTDNGGLKIYTPYEFKWASWEEYHPMPSYFTPNEHEAKILKALGDEYYYGYDYICDETGLTREEAKTAIDRLRTVGAVKFQRGLMNEDGEVGGAGFGIPDIERAEALLYRYHYERNDQ